MKKLGFRTKTFLSQIFLFLLFLAVAVPIVKHSFLKILISSFESDSKELIEEIQQAPSLSQVRELLSGVRAHIFYEVSLYDGKGDLLYEEQKPESRTPPEVLKALQAKSSFTIEPSTTFQKKFVFLASSFSYQGKTYVLRCGFPYGPIEGFTEEFSRWFFMGCVIAFLFFTALTAGIFHRLHRPIHQIIAAIRLYREGKPEKLPEMLADPLLAQDSDFQKLTDMMLSLYDQVQQNIEKITVEKQEKEAILESLVEGVVAVDASMIVRYVNFAGSKMLGMPKRHLLGNPFPNTGPTALLFEKSYNLLCSCQQHASVLTDSVEIDSGKKVYLDLIAAPKLQGTGAIIVFQDKSSQHRVLEMGKDFVANASHELRTPITIIRGFAETLQDIPDIPQEMLHDIVEKIVRNCQRMDSLVKNLLTLADVENIPLSNYQECDLGCLLENCKEMTSAIYRDAEIILEEPKDPVFAFVDPHLLELAFANLLDNAAKYSREAPKIYISLEKEGHEAKITIRDQGIGIPPQDVDHIFERFYTVNKAHSRKLGGAGLGLSLVKTIIDKHDGAIAVSSTLGIGTTFTVRLPCI